MIAWFMFAAYVAAAGVLGYAICRAAALGDLLRPYDDEHEPAPVLNIQTGEPITDHDQWAVRVVPEREPVA